MKAGSYFCDMETDIKWMRRALQLAEYGRGAVSPNPMVGCVIVHNEEVIGEGWHRNYGGPHAEVRAVEDVFSRNNQHFLSESTAYVTLEPCSHYGKTPPCADLLIEKHLKRVVICNEDPNPLVSHRGIEKLQNAGIEVITGVLEQEGLELNKRFFTNMTEKRPYVILKWAETRDGFLGTTNGEPVRISGEKSNMLVHKWRSEEDAILVGFNTAISDNPKLNVRNWQGINPVRVVLDRNLLVPSLWNVMDQTQPTLIVNYKEDSASVDGQLLRYGPSDRIAFAKIQPAIDEIPELLNKLFELKIGSVLVEGGSTVLSAFIASGQWDEIRRCQGNGKLFAGKKAPVPAGILTKSDIVENDTWTHYSRI